MYVGLAINLRGESEGRALGGKLVHGEAENEDGR